MLTVGQLLHKKRTDKGITLKKAEEQTRIRLKYLQAIERDNWSVFSSRVYIAGVIKSYASYLGVSPENALAYFRRDYEKKEEVTAFKRRLPSLQFLPETKKLLIGILVAVFVLFGLYFGYQFNKFLAPPEVAIIAPLERRFRNVEKIIIVGETQPESTVKIFNEELFPNAQGRFTYEFPLRKGTNTLTIHVTGANGKQTTHVEEFVLE